jgi:hypothetical protein
VPDFPIEALGPLSFQELVEALLIRECGVKVTPMGAGRDGGRDATTRDTLSLDAGNLKLKGYSVFQAKHRASIGTSAENESWLWGEVRSELDLWITSKERAETPETLVFVTNVPLTAYPVSGGRDAIEQKVQSYREKLRSSAASASEEERRTLNAQLARLNRLASVRILDRRWVFAGIAASDTVRRAFPALLTAGDVFAAIADFTGSKSVSAITEGLLEHARQSLTIDGAVWMAEGGDATGSRVALHKMVIDLPVLAGTGSSRGRDRLARLVIRRAERMMRPQLRAGGIKRHLVITGAAGNGKTTMAKFLVQVYRCALLRGAALSAGQKEIVDGTAAALGEIGYELPRHLRWPIRVDLKELLQRNQILDGATMLSAIAERISAELDGGRVAPASLEAWRREWPWLVIFDGFDEITDPHSRRVLIERIEQFVEEAEANNADLMVVLTTRSLGYSDEMSEKLFDRVDLDYLNDAEGINYARRVVMSTLAGDAQRQKQILEVIQGAAHSPSQRSLLRTPLQILILTIIVNGAQHLEPDRYGLFARYFDIAFEREKSKSPRLRAMLTDYEPVIRALHRNIGFKLHSLAESGASPDPVLHEQELRDLIWEELDRQGFKPTPAGDSRVQDVLDTATRRLVLLAPHDDGFRFDIRSLQELTAGQWLMEDHPDSAVEKLRVAAANPHWRNVVLFAAGYAFHGGNGALHRRVVNCLETVDDGQHWRLSTTFPVGPRLALEMVDDGMVRNRPGFRSALFSIGLDALLNPPEIDFGSIALMLIRIADEDPAERAALADRLRGAASVSAVARRNIETLRSLINPRATKSFSAARQMIVAVVDKQPNIAAAEPALAWGRFNTRTGVGPSGGEPPELLRLAAASVLQTQSALHRLDASALLRALADDEAAADLDDALSELVSTDERVLDAIRREVWPTLTRQPVAGALAALADS